MSVTLWNGWLNCASIRNDVPGVFFMVIEAKTEFCSRFSKIISLFAFVAEEQLFKIWTVTVKSRWFEYYVNASVCEIANSFDMSTEVSLDFIAVHIPLVTWRNGAYWMTLRVCVCWDGVWCLSWNGFSLNIFIIVWSSFKYRKSFVMLLESLRILQLKEKHKINKKHENSGIILFHWLEEYYYLFRKLSKW